MDGIRTGVVAFDVTFRIQFGSDYWSLRCERGGGNWRMTLTENWNDHWQWMVYFTPTLELASLIYGAVASNNALPLLDWLIEHADNQTFVEHLNRLMADAANAAT